MTRVKQAEGMRQAIQALCKEIDLGFRILQQHSEDEAGVSERDLAERFEDFLRDVEKTASRWRRTYALLLARQSQSQYAGPENCEHCATWESLVCVNQASPWCNYRRGPRDACEVFHPREPERRHPDVH